MLVASRRRFSRDPLAKVLSLRVTQEQDQLLGELAESLGLPGGKAELLRKSLDYWLEHSPEAQQPGNKGGGRTPLTGGSVKPSAPRVAK
jgi:hypothetical protein